MSRFMTRGISPTERDLIPYEASTFTAASALVLAPHPDDEVFGCGAALASLAARGADVRVLLVTDGAVSEEPEEYQRVAHARLAESRAALEILGGGRVESLGFPDRGLADRVVELATSLRTALASARPELVFVPSPVEIHPDHRAVAEAFLQAVGEHEGLVALFEVSQPFRPNFLLDATEFVERKERAMAAFASQNAVRDYPAFVRGLNAYRRMTLGPEVKAAEAYFVLEATELRKLSTAELCARIGPSAGGNGRRRRLSGLFGRRA